MSIIVSASSCGFLIPPIEFGLDSCTFLPNGYAYLTVDKHYLFKGSWGREGSAIDSFRFGNRIYVSDRYVTGEVIPTGVDYEEPEISQQYKYFILDTQKGQYSGQISKADWEKQLKTINILDDVELAPRSGAWRREMWRQFGRGQNQC